jgi:hypothetical protein
MTNRLVNKESPYLDLVASHIRWQIMTMNKTQLSKNNKLL